MNLESPVWCLTHRMTRAARVLTRGFEAAAEAQGLAMTAPQFTTLARLSGHGAMAVGELAGHLATDRTTLTRNLAVLQARGWIVPADADDRRQHRWELTEAGRKALNDVMPVWRKWQATLVDRLGTGTAADLIEALKTLETG
jgi:DNA-binding MarR family transcriptional regulator